MKLKLLMTLGSFALALSTVPAALAQCGMPTKAIKPALWQPAYGAPHMLLAADDPLHREDGKTMVGMWHVIFTATSTGGASIPPTVIDNALAVWHSDHTEIMNSVRPPQDGNFCLGVWEQVDASHYYLNHFAWYANQFPNDSPGGIGSPTGPTQFREWIKLSPNGDQFTGKFQLDAYDLSNNLTTTFTGTLTGTRITITTREKDLVAN